MKEISEINVELKSFILLNILTKYFKEYYNDDSIIIDNKIFCNVKESNKQFRLVDRLIYLNGFPKNILLMIRKNNDDAFPIKVLLTSKEIKQILNIHLKETDYQINKFDKSLILENAENGVDILMQISCSINKANIFRKNKVKKMGGKK